MQLKEFIDQAFDKYEESAELIDFKEELLTNLQDRLLSLEASGLKREEALRKIQIEFSDINKVADQMSLAKKKEVFQLQYMSLRNFVTKPRAAIYTILGAFTAFILVLAGLSYLGTYEFQKLTGVLLLFLSLPLAGFVYMGLTQETATRYPMQPVRALTYATSVFLFLFGILLVPMLVFREAKALKNILTILVPFVLPSIGVISFLFITETDQRKAWVLKEAEKQMEWTMNFGASGNAQTFGLLTGAIWILATGATALIMILKLWIFSWIPLVVALAMTMLLLAYFMSK